MTRTFTRQLTPTERVYLINSEFCPPFANQIIFEGTGVFDIDKWKKAVEIASAANPGCRVVLKGTMSWSKWVDSGKTPPVREVDGSRWSGLDPDGADFLQDILPVHGPTCEVLLVHGDPLRVVFRTHHAVMDGRATFIWADEIFRALRGESPVGYNSTMTEYEVAKSFQKKGRVPPPHVFIGPTGKAFADRPGFIWRRIRLRGYYRNPLAQIAMVLARSAWRNAEGPVRIAIPVDLRSRVPGLRSIGNITNLIYLNINKNDTPETLALDMKRQLDGGRDGELYWADQLVRYFPLRLVRSIIAGEIAEKSATGLYRNSGIISNMGKIPIENFRGGGFNPIGAFGIPPSMDAIPCFLGSLGAIDHMEIILSMPRVLANNGRLDGLIQNLKDELKEAPPR